MDTSREVIVNLTRLIDIPTIRKYLSVDDNYKVMNIEILEDFIPDLVGTLWFLVTKDNQDFGIMAIRDFSSNCVEFHGAIFKDFRNKDSFITVKTCLDILRNNSKIVYVTKTPSNNIAAIKWLHKMGFTHKTTIVNGYKTSDLLLFGEV